MLQMSLATLREGVEAFLIVAIAAAYLRQTGRAALLLAVWNLRLFFQATSIFLVLFACQLLLYAFHEFKEAGVLPIDNEYRHPATEDWAEGAYGQLLTATLVLAPIGWVLWSLRRARTDSQAA